jgi:hypothetical protein
MLCEPTIETRADPCQGEQDAIFTDEISVYRIVSVARKVSSSTGRTQRWDGWRLDR